MIPFVISMFVLLAAIALVLAVNLGLSGRERASNSMLAVSICCYIGAAALLLIGIGWMTK